MTYMSSAFDFSVLIPDGSELNDKRALIFEPNNDQYSRDLKHPSMSYVGPDRSSKSDIQSIAEEIVGGLDEHDSSSPIQVEWDEQAEKTFAKKYGDTDLIKESIETAFSEMGRQNSGSAGPLIRQEKLYEQKPAIEKISSRNGELCFDYTRSDWFLGLFSVASNGEVFVTGEFSSKLYYGIRWSSRYDDNRLSLEVDFYVSNHANPGDVDISTFVSPQNAQILLQALRDTRIPIRSVVIREILAFDPSHEKFGESFTALVNG